MLFSEWKNKVSQFTLDNLNMSAKVALYKLHEFVYMSDNNMTTHEDAISLPLGEVIDYWCNKSLQTKSRYLTKDQIDNVNKLVQGLAEFVFGFY